MHVSAHANRFEGGLDFIYCGNDHLGGSGERFEFLWCVRCVTYVEEWLCSVHKYIFS